MNYLIVKRTWLYALLSTADQSGPTIVARIELELVDFALAVGKPQLEERRRSSKGINKR